jgi:hypothetical protein
MHRFEAILLFYKPFIIWSFIANIVITMFNPTLIYALVAKLFLTIFAWFFISETSAKRRLILYNSRGFSTFQLFVSVFVIDSLLMIPYLLLIKEFI